MPLIDYGNCYERLSIPRGWWTPHQLLSRWNWMTCVYPSYPETFLSALRNARVFLSPWYSWRRRLIANAINRNGCKLINCWPSGFLMRTRGSGGDLAYYRMTCGLVRATLWRERCVLRATGEPTTHFMAGLLCAFGKDRSPDDYETVCEKVLTGPCVTRRQCEALLDRIVAATPDCGWFGVGE